MKSLELLLISIIILGIACCTPKGHYIPEEKRFFKQVYAVDSTKTKEELYKKTLEWMAKSFVSSKSVIEFQNEEDGIIIGNAGTTYGFKNDRCRFTLVIEIKKGKFRLTAENFYNQSEGYTIADEISLRSLYAKAHSLGKELRKYLNKPEEDW